MIFIPDVDRNFWDIFPQIFFSFSFWIKPAKQVVFEPTVTWKCFYRRYFYLACELSKVN